MAEQWKLTLHVEPVKRAERDGALRGLRLAAEHLLGESAAQVPHEEGTLERSGEVSVDEGQLRAAVTYNTPYAVRQHEDMTLNHDAGRKAKYLEDPFLDEVDTVEQILAEQIRRALA